MNFKKVIKTTAMSTVATAMLSTSVFASTFRDVPTSHWAYSPIDRVSNEGLMVGDMSGNFRPDSYIDRFETSKVLARMLGYTATGASASNQKYFDDAYNKNKALLNQYDTKFNKWDSTANREIAFLLEKGVLTTNDLNQFVVISTTGIETLSVLTKEDIAVYLVREIGESDKANNFTYTNPFADDSKIDSSKKKSVYYLRSIGIVNGDTNNNYNPKAPVTRAQMATLLDKTESYINVSPVEPAVQTITTVVGTIDVYYDSLNTLQIKSTTGQTGIYVIGDTASITVDGYLRTRSDLKSGMNVVGVVSDGKTLVDIKATTNSNNNNNNSNNNNNNNNNNDSNTNNGIVNSITGTVAIADSTNKTISIQTKTISPKGEISTLTNTYNVTPNTSITRDGKSVSLSNVVAGDIITCDVNGQYISNIKLELKDQLIEGTVTEKGTDSATNRPYYVVKPTNSTETVTIFVGPNSTIRRTSTSNVNWNVVKIGDKVSATTTFGVINELSASGVRSTATGYIDEILLSRENGYVVLTDKDGADPEKYYFNADNMDFYGVKLDSKIKVTLDSSEIVSYYVQVEPTRKPTSGIVQEIYRDRISITDNNDKLQNVYYNENTKYINSQTGAFTTIGTIESDDVIYAVYADDESDIATTITIVKGAQND